MTPIDDIRRMSAFGAAMLDPPWEEKGGTPKAASWGGGKRGADAHYATLKTCDMPGVIRAADVWLPGDDSHLYLWVTKTFLPDGLWLMAELGYEYKTLLTWVKTSGRFGLGQYFRGRTEPLLFGTRGRGYAVRTDARNIDDLVLGPRTAHSRKPDDAYLKVEERSRGPWVEMFGRGTMGRPGWTSWGWEAISADGEAVEEG